jgi:voltage-gated sodium channel
MAVIILNAATLGLETSATVTSRHGELLSLLDTAALAVFVVELLAKLYAYRLRFFRDPWNGFDALVVGVAMLPASGAFSVLRALRVLRMLRLISVIPSMRRVVATLLAAIPGATSIIGLLALVVYVAAVMATTLFGPTTPEHFGGLGRSLWTLFQVLTGEAWPDIADEVMAERPMAWVFFLIFILISTFVVLNLFLAVMVSAMESVRDQEVAAGEAAAGEPAEAGGSSAGARSPADIRSSADGGASRADAAVLAELAALRREVSALRDLLEAGTAPRSRS